MPAYQSAVSDQPGYLMLPRGQAFVGYDPDKHGPLWNYRLLPSRAGDAGAVVFHLICDRTYSAYGCPEWARIPLREFCEYLPHKSARAIRYVLDFLVSIHLIERDPNDPWRFKSLPENVANAPVLMPVRHPNAATKKRLARAARTSGPILTAAFLSMPKDHDCAHSQAGENGRSAPTQEIDTMAGRTGQSIEFGSNPAIPQDGNSPPELKQVSNRDGDQIIENTPAGEKPALDARTSSDCRQSEVLHHALDQHTDPVGSCGRMKQVSSDNEAGLVKPVSIDVKQVSDIRQCISAQRETSVGPGESYCPWEWACPFLSSDLTGSKPLIQISQRLQAGRSDVVVDCDAHRPANDDQLKEIRKLLVEELGDRMPGDYPSDDLCQRIYRALVGCPLEWVTTGSKGIGLLRHRIRKRQFEIDSYGLVELLARDIGKYWKESQIKSRQQEKEARARTENRLIQGVEESFQRLHLAWQALNQFADATT